MEHRKLLGASAFAALSLVFVFSTGGFSAQPSLRTQVASLEQEVSNLRASLPAAVNTSATVRQISSDETCRNLYAQCADRSGGNENKLQVCRDEYYKCKNQGAGGAVAVDPGLLNPVGRLIRNTLADVQKIQQALITKGHLKGVADGKFGLGTEVAVKAFQKANGLSETGVVDTDTSVRLFTETQLPADGKGTLASFLVKNPNGIEGPATVWMRLSDGKLWNCDLFADKTYSCHYWVPTTGSSGSTTTQ